MALRPRSLTDAILTTTDCETEAAVGAEAPGCEIHSSPPPLLTKSQSYPRQCSLTAIVVDEPDIVLGLKLESGFPWPLHFSRGVGFSHAVWSGC